ncbi:MAG: iron-containing alcohol dehydrogenase, partial [Planctomycetes bacterium]|nr:iron-containing alcohol dehydrogenase [Planctomycetota bacterium]
KGLGVCHSCAHALSAVANLHHGLANGVMIDHALRHNLVGASERFRLIARALELARDDGAAVIAWLAQLKQAIGIPTRLSEAGVSREDLPRLVDLALADGCHQNNPTPCARDDFVRIFEQAW